MNFYLLLFSFLCFVSSVYNSPNVIELTDERSTITWTATSKGSVIVQAEEGYQIQVNIANVSLDGLNGEYVSLRSAVEDEDGNEMRFTYTLSTTPSYFYNSNKLIINYVGTNNTNNFTAIFTRTGEALTTTTTQLTTSTKLLPTPKPHQNPGITVYLYGRPAASFDNSSVITLKQVIASMAAEYCTTQNFPINGSITINNVIVENLDQCPILWENYDTCISLTFAVPVLKLEQQEENAIWDGYQLNKSHLKILWDIYASKYMSKIGLSLYPVPNIKKIVDSRVIVISVVVIVLALMVISLRYFVEKLNKKRRRKLSDTISIMDNSANRSSQLSLTPHYLQELPPLFSTDFPTYPNQGINSGNYTNYNKSYTDDNDQSILQTTVEETLVKDLSELQDSAEA